jgi:hypothetical protein
VIPVARLVAAYKGLGFSQQSGETHVFFREGDGLMMFHPPFEEEVELKFILEDVACWSPDLADQLADAIAAHGTDK